MHVDAAFEHRPVMGREVVELLMPVPPGVVIDGTIGGGGHSRLLLEARPDLHVLGIDRDPRALEAAGRVLAPYGDRVRIVSGEFGAIGEIAAQNGDEGDIVGILLDLGVSSPQLDREDRGFSFRFPDAPLDMRMDSRQTLTAAQVVNEYSEDELTQIIADNGEERFARRIARRIVAARPLHTTGELVDVIKDGIPAATRRKGGHPARRTFQAIRMEVNRELPNLAEALDESVHLLVPGGRMLVLSYHSLEDRMVKDRFADWSGARQPRLPGGPLPIETPETGGAVRLVTSKPMRPGAAELAENPRSEAARLRAVERNPHGVVTSRGTP